MQDGVGIVGVLLQQLNGFSSRRDAQLDLATPSFFFDFLHYQKSTSACANNEAITFPGYLLVYGYRRMSELISELLGRLFLALANFTTINHDVVFIRDAINLNGTK